MIRRTPADEQRGGDDEGQFPVGKAGSAEEHQRDGERCEIVDEGIGRGEESRC